MCSDLIPHDLTKSSLPDKIAGQRLRQVEHLNSGDLLIDLSACGASAFGSKRVGRELTQNGRRHCYPLASGSNPVGSIFLFAQRRSVASAAGFALMTPGLSRLTAEVTTALLLQYSAQRESLRFYRRENNNRSYSKWL
ncbi:MAG: hypothetical protein DME99_02250 [Verrucomicrobia bacterium]|nr:MAG: hypothetical protein DME99_02250 [Verrucomicrobiota bacterium]